MKEEKTKVKKRPPAEEEKIIDEGDDKRVIVFISIAILVIIGTVIGLLVGCQKAEVDKTDNNIIEPSDETDDTGKDVVEESKVVTSVVKTSTKTEEKESFMVTFHYNDNQNSFIKKVVSGNTVTPYLPAGFEGCNYYSGNSENKFNFNNKITSNTDIYMDCFVTEYNIVYDEETTNQSTYSVIEGTVALDPLTVQDKMFVGWYSDPDFTNKVDSLSQSIISLADDSHTIYLYAKIVDSFNYTVYNDDETVAASGVVSGNTYTTPAKNNSYCTNEKTLLGWTTSSGSSTINYGFDETTTLTDDISLYPVCGSAVVIYESEDEVKVVGYTEEELATYEVPTTEDLGFETPTYYVPVETPTDKTKQVIADDRDYVAENEVKLADAALKAAEGYFPQVGDILEEHEKEFDGWTTEDKTSPTPGEQVEVPADFTPPENDTTTLQANWVEPVPYVVETPPAV